MKKIIALVVAILMMAAMAVPAFAAVTVTGSDALQTKFPLSGGTTITYGTSQKYEVTIPSAVDLNEPEEDGYAVTVSNYSLAANKELYITIDSQFADTEYQINNDKKWYLFEDETQTQTGATDVEYIVTVDSAPIARGGEIISANINISTDPVTKYLKFSTNGTSQVAAFTDTVNFTANLRDYTKA